MNTCLVVSDPGSARDQVATSRAGERARPFRGQAFWFIVVGVVSTGLNAALYLLLRQWWDLVTANLIALAMSTVASSEANRLLTFAGISTTRSSLGTQSVLVFLFYGFYSTVTLWALHLVVADATPEAEAVTLLLVSSLGGIGRFLLLRLRVFGKHQTA